MFLIFLEIIAYALRPHKEPNIILKRNCLQLGLSMLFVRSLGSLPLPLSQQYDKTSSPLCQLEEREERTLFLFGPMWVGGSDREKNGTITLFLRCVEKRFIPSPFLQHIHTEETGEVPFLLLFPHVCKRGTNWRFFFFFWEELTSLFFRPPCYLRNWSNGFSAPSSSSDVFFSPKKQVASFSCDVRCRRYICSEIFCLPNPGKISMKYLAIMCGF